MSNNKPSQFISAMLHSDIQLVKSNTKVCVKCKTLKPIKEFPKCTRSLDGRRKVCKRCNYDIANEQYNSKKSERDFWKSMMPI